MDDPLEQFCYRMDPRAELMRRVTKHFPEIDPEALRLLTELKHVSQGFSALMQEPLQGEGLSEGKFCVLMLLWLEEMEEPREILGPSEIAEMIGVTRSTLTGLLDGLERENYVQRHHLDSDRRALSVTLQEKGRRLMDDFLPGKVLFLNRVRDALTADERETLLRLLLKLEQCALPEKSAAAAG